MTRSATTAAPVWWLQGKTPSHVVLPPVASKAVVYLFEDSQSCLRVDGLAGGTAQLSPGEWLFAPLDALELQLQGIRDLNVHGVVLAVALSPNPASRHLFSKCEIPVVIGPGWRVRLLAGAVAGRSASCSGTWVKMFDVFIEPGATLADDAFAGARIDVLAGEMIVGGRVLTAGEHALLTPDETSLRSAYRSHALVTQGLMA